MPEFNNDPFRPMSDPTTSIAQKKTTKIKELQGGVTKNWKHFQVRNKGQIYRVCHHLLLDGQIHELKVVDRFHVWGL